MDINKYKVSQSVRLDQINTKEVVEDAGILIRKRTPEQIRRAINTLIKNPSKLKKLQKKSVVRAEFFSWKNILKNYLSLYEKVIS